MKSILRLALFSLLFVALLTGWYATAYAAALTVNTVADENDHSCGDGDCSLRDAVELAASGDTITFNLTYPASIILTGGQIVIGKNLAISGPGASNLTVDGNYASRVLRITPGVTVSISGLTIARGHIAENMESPTYGAGIQNEGTLTVTDSTFYKNKTRYFADGAAMSNHGTMTVIRSAFSENFTEAFQGYGGNAGAIWNNGTLTVSDSTFSGNTCHGWGGAIFNHKSLTVTNTAFSGNSAGLYGGAIAESTGAAATVDGSTFTNNRSGQVGGALDLYPNGTMIITNSTFSGNTASSGGGAIDNGASLSIRGSTFVNNRAATLGGAIENSHVLSVTDSTFAGNHSDERGGAIHDYFGTTVLTNDTFTGNTAATEGGAISIWGVATITNVTLSGNSSPGGDNLYVYYTPTGGHYATVRNTVFANPATGANCSGTITDGGGNVRWPSPDASCVGAFGDPKLGPLQNNGGPTSTMALAAGSAALGAGVAATCPTTDQRGQPRPNPPGTRCDAGAYESSSGPPVLIYEENHSSVQYNGWIGVQNASASGDGYRVSKVANDKVTYKFTGTSVKWVTMKGPDQGKAQVQIDGVNKGTFDLYSASVQWKAVPKVFSGLANKSHTLVVKVLGTKNASSKGMNVVVDAFVVGVVTKEDSATGVQYNNWVGTVQAGASGGSHRSAKPSGSKASFKFTGTGISWITALGPAYGKADVYIDGVKKQSYDLYQATAKWQVVKSITGLSAGAHTIEVRVLGTKRVASTGTTVVVDAFRVP